jgi:hypothetical protein
MEGSSCHERHSLLAVQMQLGTRLADGRATLNGTRILLIPSQSISEEKRGSKHTLTDVNTPQTLNVVDRQ